MIVGRRMEVGAPVRTLLAGLILAAIAALGSLGAIGAAAIAAFAFILLNPGAAMPLLIVASALNRYGYAWGDAEIRLEILVGLLLAAVVANQLAVRTISPRIFRQPLVLPLLGYTLVNVVSTILFAVERTRGLKLDAEIVVVWLIYVAVLAYLSDARRLRNAISALWVVTVGEALIGLFAVLAFVLHVSTFGIQFDPFGLPMVFGTEWEANIFGSYLLGNFFILLADYFGRRRPPLYAVGLLIVVAGIGVSLTRTAWLALVLGAVLFAILLIRLRRPRVSLLPIVGAVPVVALIGLILGSATPLAGRLMDLLNLQSSSAAGRIVWFQAALTDWLHHPILGSGTGSFNFGAVPGAPHPWLPNLFLLTLHDTGIVGLAILAALIISFYRVCFAALRGSSEWSLLAAGAIASFTALLLAFQTTSGFWFAYPWIVAAIAIRAASLSTRDELDNLDTFR